jgi:hypothetical protein
LEASRQDQGGWGIKAGFKEEWIVGNSLADKLANEAMHELINEQGVKIAHEDLIKEARSRISKVVRPFENMSKDDFASFGALGVKEPLMSFAGHNFVAWSGKGFICEKCGIATKNGKVQAVLGRCYDLAGVLEGIHSSQCLSRFH